ncbi:MAG: hypothetical protein ACFFDT_36215, partial [Candidatus Hodarchaeota archaeon]
EYEVIYTMIVSDLVYTKNYRSGLLTRVQTFSFNVANVSGTDLSYGRYTFTPQYCEIAESETDYGIYSNIPILRYSAYIISNKTGIIITYDRRPDNWGEIIGWESNTQSINDIQFTKIVGEPSLLLMATISLLYIFQRRKSS